jgi:CMP-N-acetylneuraminic acid synthetase
MKNLIAIIPARKADILFKDKNILPIGESNLLINKILQLKAASLIDEIIVSSDSEDYLQIAKQYGVSIDKRPSNLSLIETDFGQFIEYLASKLECTHIMWAPTITPFINSIDYNDLISIYFNSLNDGYDSLITVNRLRRNVLDDNGPLNFTFSKSDFKDFPDIYEYVNGVSIARRTDVLDWKYNWGRNPKKIDLGKFKSLNICDPEDYKMAQALFNLANE